MKNFTFLLFIAALFYACNNQAAKENGAGDRVDANNYEQETIPGSSWLKLTRKDDKGQVFETGFSENGKKVGTWLVYDSGDVFPKEMITYANGMYNGTYIQFGPNGQIQILAQYRNNKLHGHWGKYRFSRVEEEAMYKDGKLDGAYKVYDTKSGFLKSSVEYKDGVQHGFYRAFNEKGQITLEYEYKNGERVSGGIIKTGEANAPQ